MQKDAFDLLKKYGGELTHNEDVRFVAHSWVVLPQES